MPKTQSRSLWRKLTGFGYDAVTQRGRRKVVGPLLQSEDAETTPLQRARLTTESRNLYRNFTIARWLINQHLNYVSTFAFQAKTGNAALDTELERLVKEVWSKKENCDVAGRHSLPRIIRLAEARKTIDGDCGLLKTPRGLIQAIEGDRIRTPDKVASGQRILHGVQVDEAGKAIAYAVHKRASGLNGFEFERLVSASNLYLHAAYERFDQVRGVSPIASAINNLKDTYEGFDHVWAKIKVASLFGLAINRQALEAAGEYEAEVDEDGNPTGRYQIDFGKGPFYVELEPGDTAQFLECHAPATEQQAFFEMMIQVALKSLDIPYSFYDESYTNYSGSRGAYLQYEQSADIRRNDVRDMLDYLTAWRLALYVQDGFLPGVSFEQLRWQWVHRGMPWLDPLKEVQAEVQSMDALLDNAEDIAQRHGRNFYENVDKQAACMAYAKSKGVPFLAGSISHSPASEPPAESNQGSNKNARSSKQAT